MHCNDCEYAEVWESGGDLACQCGLSLDAKEDRTADGQFIANTPEHVCPLTLDKEELIATMHSSINLVTEQWQTEVAEHALTQYRLNSARTKLGEAKQLLARLKAMRKKGEL